MQKGFATILLISVIVVIIIGGAFYFLKKPFSPTPIIPVVKTQQQPTPTSVDETANWKTFASPTGHFSIKYPPELNEMHIGDSATYSEQVTIGKNVTGITEQNNASISIQVQKNNGPNGPAPIQNAKDYLQNSLKSYQGGPGFISGKIDPFKLNGKVAYKLSFRFKPNNVDAISIAADYKDSVFIIIGKETTDFDQILATFKFTN